MLHSTSIKVRLLVSISSNAIRAALTFFTGLLIARALNPSGYGDLMFLLGSFVAIRPLIDMGASSAFFTFSSQQRRNLKFSLVYFAWLLFQFVIALLLIAAFLPSNIFEKVWLGHARSVVALAFVASFMQQQIWQTVGQIGESKRKTVKVQLLNLGVALTYLSAISALSTFGGLSVEKVLYLLIAQYAAAVLLAWWFLRDYGTFPEYNEMSLKEIGRKYWTYCKPLIALSAVSFSYDFADKWMLQRFGGSDQQGYFQIANQFSAVSLLATSSILTVFWKEIAAAWEMRNLDRVATLYKRVNRGLVMLGAILTGLLLPWSKQLVSVFLGQNYVGAWPVLAIMLLYPIHQSMGQIGGTMLFASGQTKKYMMVSSFTMLISIPISYFMLAPTSGSGVSGLGLAAVGMAVKMVVLGIVSVNLQALVIARACGWKTDWAFQVVGIPLVLGLGYLAKLLAGVYWQLNEESLGYLVAPFAAAASFYGVSVLIALWFLPWLIGFSRDEAVAVAARFTALLRLRHG